MLIFKHVLLAVATTLTPSLYRTQCTALLAGDLRSYAATLAPSYRFVDLGGKVEKREQILATFARWFQTKSGRIERCRASAPSASGSASELSVPLHIVEEVAVAIPTEGTRNYRIDLRAIERWGLVDGSWRAVESRVVSRSIAPI